MFPGRHRLLAHALLFEDAIGSFEDVIGSWGMFSYGRRPSAPEAFYMFLGRHRLLVQSCLFEDAIGSCRVTRAGDAVLQTTPSAQRVLAESCGNLVQVEGAGLKEGAAEGMLWMHLCS